ncbi:hypothetical protein [Paenibacillus sp. GCM10027626]|uniref:hypothetical protein n=1 Tax=Paenibacillus sp. GCM10027626 TaxID=3273411 RepID=UPI003630226A
MWLRWAGWLAKTIAAGLIISFLSIWTAGYIVNSYVETLLKQFNLPLETKPFALSGMWGSLWGANPPLKQAKESASADADTGTGTGASVGAGTKGSGNNSSTPDDNAQQTPPADDSSTSTKPPTAQGEKDTGLPDGSLTDVGGGQGTKAGSGTSGEGDSNKEALEQGMALTPEQINKAKSEISSEDKEKLFTVMMTKLPQEAWQQISKLMEDGLTEEEMTTVQQIVAQHLSREEYNQMMEILKKY